MNIALVAVKADLSLFGSLGYSIAAERSYSSRRTYRVTPGLAKQELFESDFNQVAVASVAMTVALNTGNQLKIERSTLQVFHFNECHLDTLSIHYVRADVVLSAVSNSLQVFLFAYDNKDDLIWTSGMGQARLIKPRTLYCLAKCH
jgi:hypothetical protein